MKPIYLEQGQKPSEGKTSNKPLTLLATSNASWSAVNRTYAFFLPSGLYEFGFNYISKIHRITNNISPDEGVDFSSLNIIQLLHRILNLTLVRLDIHNEHERIVLFNLLHRRFRSQRPFISNNQYFLLQ